MVSEEDARETFSEVLEYANCDPGQYYRDFLITRTKREQQEEYEFEKIDFHSNIHTEIGINLTEQIQRLWGDIGDEEDDEEDDENDLQREILPYSVDNYDMSPKPIQYIEVDSIPNSHRFRSLLNDLSINNVTDFSTYSNIEYQAFRVKGSFQPKMVAFRLFTSRQIVGKNHRVKVALTGQNEYDKVEDNPVALPDQFDAVYCDDLIFVINPGKFEKLFDYFEAYEEDANEIFDHIEESNINIAEFDKFKQTVKNSDSQLRTMRRIKQRGRYEDLNRRLVEEMVDKFEVEVVVGEDEDGEWQIQLDDFRKVGEILNLFDDHFVFSGMDVLSGSEELQKYLAKGDIEAR
mgnify:CR=1 FL=1